MSADHININIGVDVIDIIWKRFGYRNTVQKMRRGMIYNHQYISNFTWCLLFQFTDVILDLLRLLSNCKTSRLHYLFLCFLQKKKVYIGWCIDIRIFFYSMRSVLASAPKTEYRSDSHIKQKTTHVGFVQTHHYDFNSYFSNNERLLNSVSIWSDYRMWGRIMCWRRYRKIDLSLANAAEDNGGSFTEIQKFYKKTHGHQNLGQINSTKWL